MNYQGPYYRNKNDNTYMKKLSIQLIIVFIIMLLFLLIKFASNNVTLKINEKAKQAFYKDYTEETSAVFSSFLPDTKETLGKFIGKKVDFTIESMPVSGKVLLPFGETVDPATKESQYNNGINLESKEGEEIKVVYDGRVERIESDEKYGIIIAIDHGNGYQSIYGNVSDIKVSEGDSIKKGDILGVTGKPKSGQPYVYFEIKKDGESVNPFNYLKESSN